MTGPGESNEPRAWREGQAAARAARALVAQQLTEMITEREMTGGRAMFTRRLRQLLETQARQTGRQGETVLLRAAVMEVARAAALWAVALDLRARGR